MTPCRGLHRINCTRKSGCPGNLKKDVQPECISCPDALTEMVDLEGKVFFEYRIKKQAKGKKLKAKS